MYSAIAPIMMKKSKKIVDKISEHWTYLKKHKIANRTTQSVLLVAGYYPINCCYWISSSIKNQIPLTSENMRAGAVVVGLMSIYYLAVEYYAVSKINTPEKMKNLRPYYTISEIVYNTLFATGNYIVKRLK